MHEYFYGRFDSEYFHEFCETKIEVDRDALETLRLKNP